MKDIGNAIWGYRIEHRLYRCHLSWLAWIVRSFIYLIHNSYIPYTCNIGKGTIFAYKGIGVVIHSEAVIGEDCLIGTNVTIGGRSGHMQVPIIGNNVEICSGAKVLGPIRIGDNVVIGANAVVITDVPSNSIFGGIPAKCLSKK